MEEHVCMNVWKMLYSRKSEVVKEYKDEFKNLFYTASSDAMYPQKQKLY